MKPSISLCMIARNEENLLEKCLNPIKSMMDEIIIADTGSKDKTRETARKFTKRVYDFEWCDDFSKARNFSISKATKDWILVLDPDEKLAEEDMIKLKTMINSNKNGVLGYRLIQKTYYKNRILSIRGICRVFRNDKRIRFTYPIHETVRESIKDLKGRIGKTGIAIRHYPRINNEKKEYYLKLLKIKKEKFPESNADKEIENECKLMKGKIFRESLKL